MRTSPQAVRAAVLIFLSAVSAAIAGTSPGDADVAFDAGLNREVFALATQPDGKIIAGGEFTVAGGLPRPHFVRLNPDGTPDPGSSPVMDYFVQAACVEADGRLLVTGAFTTMNGAARLRVARLLPDCTLDSSFAVSSNQDIRCLSLQSNGAFVFGGAFTQINGITRNYLARVSAGGTVDSAYNPAPDTFVRCILQQPDGKAIIAGNFSSIGGSARSRIARLNANTSLDTSFTPAVTGTAVYCANLQADGKILLGGVFTSVAGTARTNLARVTAAGTLDTAFTATANDIVRSMLLQADGKIIVGGHFTQINGTPRNRIARLHADGNLDTAFNPNANDLIYALGLQADGKVLASGEADTFGGVVRAGLARLHNDPATQSLTVPDTTRIRWMRGGSAPETNQVTFEVAAGDSSTWTSSGNGTRITGGWERTGLSLPASGRIRARARVLGGYGNGSSGLVETIATFSPLEMWRLANFGTASGTGGSADNADPDKDGLENLVEFAFGLNPGIPDAAGLPVWQRDDDTFTLTFSRPANVSGVTYIAESSSSLTPGSWTSTGSTIFGNTFTFFTAAIGSRLYLRLRVTAP